MIMDMTSIGKAWFITGTDTNVGKTFVSAGIVRALKRLGLSTGVMKPVETGCQATGGLLAPKDAIALKEASGAEDPIDLINPFRFILPLAPLIAAEEEGRAIEPAAIKTAFEAIRVRHSATIVEGAGGLLVPVTRDMTMAEIALLLDIPVIIVAASRLGAINHTAMTVECAKSRGLVIAGIILNSPSEPVPGDISVAGNAGAIERLTGISVIAEIPYNKKPAPSVSEEGRFELLVKKLL